MAIMILSQNIVDTSAATDVFESSINLNSLYCSHLWANTNLRNAIITAPNKDKNGITYCYTCQGKIRKYELQPTKNFTPHIHSTPNKQTTIGTDETSVNELRGCPIDENTSKAVCSLHRTTLRDSNVTDDIVKQHIPSISHQVDSDITHTFRSYEIDSNDTRRGSRRLRKSLKGIGCVIKFASTDGPVKKRTQIQACSISVMIIAIVIISFILVNFNNPIFIATTNVIRTTVVPTKNTELNETASAISNHYSELPVMLKMNSSTEEYITTKEYPIIISTENSRISRVISKIRKNIRTYPKSEVKEEGKEKLKFINNRDLSHRFCSCQNNEICMLDENSGTSICRKAIDVDDPTGCGGLCALETEACQLVDKARGVRVCRLLTQVTCSPEEWRCQNGLCVPAEARCNGSIQCYDRSDEMYCECDLTKQFRCGHSISCFPHSKLCDGVIDCWDGHDEVNCTTECPDDQFTCNDSQCILASRFCDGLADCADGSDEPDGCGGACGTHELRCRNQRCVKRTLRCDGRDNCGDGSDEMQCPQ